jgi:hypothetical protein
MGHAAAQQRLRRDAAIDLWSLERGCCRQLELRCIEAVEAHRERTDRIDELARATELDLLEV